ncbi:MAG: NAD-dependent epimerase/dehydratase family protein [Anaerolineae bacterium]
MKIVVTGGIGNVGRVAVARLLRHGHEVRILDRSAPEAIEERLWETVKGAEYHQVDTTDFSALAPLFEGMDAVVHLAAYASPHPAPSHEIFRVNCGGTFNVYQAAANVGIKRVVSASSINALGYNYGIKGFDIQYFPIDEDHPDFTTDIYSFSKRMLEETAAYFWRREGISGVCLRFPGVMNPTLRWGNWMRFFAQGAHAAFDAVLALPPEKRTARIRAIVDRAEARRAERHHEWRPNADRWWRRNRMEGPRLPEELIIWGRTDFWTLIHVEDVAQAIEKGLTVEYEGSHPIFVNDSHNTLGVSSQQLAELFFPEVTTWKRPVPGSEALVSYERARDLIGFEPEHPISTWDTPESA